MSDLRTLTDDLLARAGLATAQASAAALPGYIPGLAVSDRARLRDVLEDLQGLLQFDCIESGPKLILRPRGQTPAASIPETDLLPLKKNSTETLTLTRLAESTLAEQIDVLSLDPAREYQATTQTAQRQVSPALSAKTVRFGGALAATQARRAAQQLLDALWAERFAYQFALPPKYLYMEPGDVVNLTWRGKTHTVRLTRLVTEGVVVRAEGVSTDLSVYAQAMLAGTTKGGGSAVQLAAATLLYALDVPLAEAGDDGLAWFAVPVKSRGDSQWQSATVFESLDGGVSFEPRAMLTAGAVAGAAASVLGTCAYPDTWDDARTVDVLLSDGSLSSFSDDLILNGANTAVLGNEIIQFANAALIAPNTYRLSRLLRGRRGTEWAMTSHLSGERFVLLGAEVVRQPLPLNARGQARVLKAVSNGGVLADAAPVAFTPTGACLKPLSPVWIKGIRAVGGDLTITWIRRSRIGGGWQDSGDVPVGEVNEAYEVDILNAGGTAVLRTLSVAGTSSIVYPAAQQVADFGSVQANVNVAVYQLSAVMGRGWEGKAGIS
ncbi:MAG: phage tail protein [Holosporales bacterium]